MEKILSNKYELIEEIASGGMGTVYKVRQRNLNRLVAIKLLHPQYSSDLSFLKRFQREARSMARLEHPNIIRVYDVEKDDTLHYIVMEYVEGNDLRSIIITRGTISPDETVNIIRQIALALSCAHKNGVIHRDIKPGNIIVTQLQMVKVGDFGIAGAADEATVTSTGQLLGTPEYMSPEQARGESIDPRMDIYSLGMVMYKMLTGMTPFDNLSKMSIVGKLITDRTDLPLIFPEDIPEKIRQIVQKLLHKDINARYFNAEALIKEIDLYLSNTTTMYIHTTEDREKTGTWHPSVNAQHTKDKIDLPTELLSSESMAAQEEDKVSPTAGSHKKTFLNRKYISFLIIFFAILLSSIGGFIYYAASGRFILEFKSNQRETVSIKADVYKKKKEAEKAGAKVWVKTDYENAIKNLKEADTLYEKGVELYERRAYIKAIDALIEVKSIYTTLIDRWDNIEKDTKEEIENTIAEIDRIKKETSVLKDKAYSIGAEERLPDIFKEADIIYKEGDTAFNEGNYMDARKSFEHALSRFKEAYNKTVKESVMERNKVVRFRRIANKAKSRMKISKKKAEEASNTTIYQDAVIFQKNGDLNYKRHDYIQASKFYDQANEKFRIAMNLRPEDEQIIKQKDIKELEEILKKFKNAYEEKNISVLKQLSVISSAKDIFLKNIFDNYISIDIKIDNPKIIDNYATSTLTIQSLTNQLENNIQPGKTWKKSKLTIPYNKGKGWGKIDW